MSEIMYLLKKIQSILRDLLRDLFFFSDREKEILAIFQWPVNRNRNKHVTELKYWFKSNPVSQGPHMSQARSNMYSQKLGKHCIYEVLFILILNEQNRKGGIY